MPREDDGFLSRWSRRKRVAEAEAAQAPPGPAAPPPDDTAAAAVPDPVAEPQAPEPATLSDEDLAALPRIEDLTAGSDIRGFLRPGVPVALKNAALRRIWMLTPAIRDYRDPAVDYAWDWNTPGGVPGDGVAPSAERAAEMLRTLMEPRPSAPDPAPDPATVADPPAPMAETAPDDPGGTAAPVAAETLADAEKVHVPKDKDEGRLPARRHGGALPS